ncbi:MAG TPA: response regulator transcription factor [Burkholderiales bacterium]|nr:response regulator transcription factor [Burkholderiales bacterium]
MKILVVEDQAVPRELMISVAQAAFPRATVWSAADLASGLRSAGKMENLDIVLLDLGLPDSEGLDGLLCFRADFPQAKVVIVSSQDTPELIADALDFGAVGFISKSLGIPGMMAALKVVAQGGIYHPPGFARPPSGRGTRA